MTGHTRWWATAGVVVCLVLSSLLITPLGAAAAPRQVGEGCTPDVDMFNNDRYSDYYVEIRSNSCGIQVRGVFYDTESELVPAGPYGAPPKYSGWSCGPAVTGAGQRSVNPKHVGYITTTAMGWQVRGTDGRWHTKAYRNFIPDPAIGRGDGPWTYDGCAGNGTQGQAESWPPPFPPR